MKALIQITEHFRIIPIIKLIGKTQLKNSNLLIFRQIFCQIELFPYQPAEGGANQIKSRLVYFFLQHFGWGFRLYICKRALSVNSSRLRRNTTC